VIDLEYFRSCYRGAIADIAPFLTRERQAAISRHNLGLHPDHYDIRTYLRASERRYVLAVSSFNRHNTADGEAMTALEVGGFLGAFPLALSRAGVAVTLVEEYDYYHGALDELRSFLEREGIEIWSVDFTLPLEAPVERRFTLVSNMAMLEHLPSTPRALMANLRSCLAERGTLLVEVPNIAYWPNRLRLLRGQSVHQAFSVYYATEPPFMGHHREYTANELRQLLAMSGFAIWEVVYLNYSADWRDADRLTRLRMSALNLPTRLIASCREVILAIAAHKRQNEAEGLEGLT
jgi:SAM-dependent methyltransferase